MLRVTTDERNIVSQPEYKEQTGESTVGENCIKVYQETRVTYGYKHAHDDTTGNAQQCWGQLELHSKVTNAAVQFLANEEMFNPGPNLHVRKLDFSAEPCQNKFSCVFYFWVDWRY